MIKRVMLAAKFDGYHSSLKFPLFASYKLDGIRAHVAGGRVLSRTNKPIPNNHVQALFGQFEHFDGELILGSPTDSGVFNKTTSAVMSVWGRPDITYYVFDYTDYLLWPYSERFCNRQWGDPLPHNIKSHTQRLIESWDDLEAFEEEAIMLGFEGIVTRKPSGRYKEGRSTLNEQLMVKIKRYDTSEALVLSAYEQTTNENVAFKDETGATKHSSHQENKTPNGHLGGFCVRDLETGVEFNIGTFQDMTREQRYFLWQEYGSETWRNQIVTFRHMPFGAKDRPRHPILIGVRNEIDV